MTRILLIVTACACALFAIGCATSLVPQHEVHLDPYSGTHCKEAILVGNRDYDMEWMQECDEPDRDEADPPEESQPPDSPCTSPPP